MINGKKIIVNLLISSFDLWYNQNQIIQVIIRDDAYRPIFGRLINQTKGDRCDIYLVSDLHIFYYQKRGTSKAEQFWPALRH
jgi:hypothetical protein